MVREVKCPDCKGKGWDWQGNPYAAADGDIDMDVEKECCIRCGGAGMIITDDNHIRGGSNEANQ